MKALRAIYGFVALAGPAFCAVVAGHSVYPLDAPRIDLQNGSHVFRAKCASCHSLNGSGPNYGPGLDALGKSGRAQIEGMSLEEYVITSIVLPDAYRQAGAPETMPSLFPGQLTKSEVRDVAAYVCDQVGNVSFSRLLDCNPVVESAAAKVSVPSVQLHISSLMRGQELFVGKAKCVACHPLDSAPGFDLFAPSLLRIGLRSREELRRAILSPSASVRDKYQQWLVRQDGEAVTGQRLPSQTDSIRLLCRTQDGGCSERTFRLEDLEVFDDETIIRKAGVSPMPEYRATLTDEEVEALIDFLSMLR